MATVSITCRCHARSWRSLRRRELPAVASHAFSHHWLAASAQLRPALLIRRLKEMVVGRGGRGGRGGRRRREGEEGQGGRGHLSILASSARPPAAAWLEELLLLMVARERKPCSSEVLRKRWKADRCGSRLKCGESHGGSRGPLPWPIGADSVTIIITLRRFVPSSSFFSTSFYLAFSSVLLGGLSAGRFTLLPLPHRH